MTFQELDTFSECEDFKSIRSQSKQNREEKTNKQIGNYKFQFGDKIVL